MQPGANKEVSWDESIFTLATYFLSIGYCNIIAMKGDNLKQRIVIHSPVLRLRNQKLFFVFSIFSLYPQFGKAELSHNVC